MGPTRRGVGASDTLPRPACGRPAVSPPPLSDTPLGLGRVLVGTEWQPLHVFGVQDWTKVIVERWSLPVPRSAPSAPSGSVGLRVVVHATRFPARAALASVHRAAAVQVEWHAARLVRQPAVVGTIRCPHGRVDLVLGRDEHAEFLAALQGASTLTVEADLPGRHLRFDAATSPAHLAAACLGGPPPGPPPAAIPADDPTSGSAPASAGEAATGSGGARLAAEHGSPAGARAQEVAVEPGLGHYLGQARGGWHKLTLREQDQLGDRLAAGRLAAAELAEATDGRRRRRLRRVLAAELEARDTLVLAYGYLPVGLVKRLYRKPDRTPGRRPVPLGMEDDGPAYDELIGIGNLALVEAATEWDNRRCEFGMYAAARIRGALLRTVLEDGPIRVPSNVVTLNRHVWTARADAASRGRALTVEEVAAATGARVSAVKTAENLPRVLPLEATAPRRVRGLLSDEGGAFEAGYPLGEVRWSDLPRAIDALPALVADAFRSEPVDDPHRVAVDNLRYRQISIIMECLSARSEGIVLMHCGFRSVEPMTFEAIAEIYGITRSRAAQIFQQTIRRLQHRGFADLLAPYWFSHDAAYRAWRAEQQVRHQRAQLAQLSRLEKQREQARAAPAPAGPAAPA